MKKLNALVIGATGATGRELVSLLLENKNFSSVTIFVRKKPNIIHDKLIIHCIDFSKLDKYKDLVKGDVLFSALGTTLKAAGSKEKQYLVDFSYQYQFAQIASNNNVNSFSLVSSAGANSYSMFFYPKIKGELEDSVKELNFQSIQIFQPSFLIRQEDLLRSNEKIGIKIFSVLNNFGLFRSLKPITVNFLANRMIQEVLIINNNILTYKLEDILVH